MSHVNDGITTCQFGNHVLAFDDSGMINASLLVKPLRVAQVKEFFRATGVIDEVADLVKSSGRMLPPQWLDPHYARANRKDLILYLGKIKILREEPGSVGGHVPAAPGVPGSGVINLRAGLWVRHELAVRLVRWAESRQDDSRESPLADFVKQALSKPRAKARNVRDAMDGYEVADEFTYQVSAETLEHLRAIDRQLINSGIDAELRRVALKARVDRLPKTRGLSPEDRLKALQARIDLLTSTEA
ncbi:hypothetical protein [Pseudomonas sp. LRF_L74]|uniref:hypothetical protein n=1 Tax=Pseudomonas sp. LRF_L74 TaxID=3369422 RepID=UPI003F621175